MLVTVEGSEAVRPNEFPQLEVSAIADDPTTSLAAGPPPPLGADCLWPYNFVVYVYSLCKDMVYIAGRRFIVCRSSLGGAPSFDSCTTD